VDAGPATIGISWSTEPTYSYQMETSTDLVSWSPWNPPVIATAASLSVNVPRGAQPGFWRVKILVP
jgi:hypothetical protein